MKKAPLLLLYPVIELLGLIWAGQVFGFLGTVFIIIITGILGGWVLRYVGFSTAMNLQAVFNNQKKETAIHGTAERLLLGVAGILLILPGVVGDLLGVVLLIPYIRHYVVKKYLKGYVKEFDGFSGQATNHNRQESPSEIIEGEWERKDD